MAASRNHWVSEAARHAKRTIENLLVRNSINLQLEKENLKIKVSPNLGKNVSINERFQSMAFAKNCRHNCPGFVLCFGVIHGYNDVKTLMI